MLHINKYFALFIGLFLYGQAIAGGGPDAYGYTWLDSNDPGGPTFSWIDITAVGTEVTGLADDNSVPFIPMGFDFHYYWSDYNQVKVGSNGWLSFNNVANISHCFPNLPTAGGAGDNIVCPLMGDLNFSGATNPGSMYYFTDPTPGAERFIISYINAPFWVNANPDYIGDNTFQVIYDNADSSITFQYQLIDAAIANQTACTADVAVGIENITGNIGLEVLADAMPASNYAVKFYYPDMVNFMVPDITPSWNMNVDNGGIFVLPQDELTLQTNLENAGNADIATVTSITGQMRNLANVLAWSGTGSVASILIGANELVDLAPTVTSLAPGQYALNVSASNADDINPSNNNKTSEIGVLDTTGTSVTFTYASQTVPAVGTVSWSGGNGDEGAGIYIESPHYPLMLESVDVWVASAGALDGFTIKVIDSDGPAGTGTLIGSQSVATGAYTNQDWNNVSFATPLVINGPFYVGWFMDGGDVALGTEDATFGPVSNRTFEIIAGAWAQYRMSTAEDFLINVNVENTFPSPIVGINDPLVDYQLTISPNPAVDHINIDLNDLNASAVLVYDNMGKLLINDVVAANANNHRIDLAAYNAGVYFVSVVLEEGVSTSKKVLLTK